MNKLDPRWEDGIYAGLRIESGEVYVMSQSGMIKVKHYKQRPESERWNLAMYSLCESIIGEHPGLGHEHWERP